MKPTPMWRDPEFREMIRDPEKHTLGLLIRSLRNRFFHCRRCRYFHEETKDMVFPTCKAYPRGIPNPIWLGQKRHVKVMFNQDNDIVFKYKPYGSKEGV